MDIPAAAGATPAAADGEALAAARRAAAAHRAAAAELDRDVAAAQEQHARAARAVAELAASIVDLTIEQFADETLMQQAALWEHVDFLEGAFALDARRPASKLAPLKERVKRGLDRYLTVTAADPLLLEKPRWNALMAKLAGGAESRWANLAARLTRDANATMEPAP